MVSYLVAAGNLELAVKISAPAVQRQETSVRACDRLDKQIMYGVSLLVSHSDQQSVHDLTVNFDIPGLTSRILQCAIDDIGIGDGGKHCAGGIESQNRAIRKAGESRGV